MKLSRFIHSFVVLATIFTAASVTTAVHAQEYKIGVVNAVRILEQSPQARRTTALIEKEFSPRDRQLVADQKELKELEDRLARDSAIMSESERRDLEREIINKRRELKRDEEEFREDLTFRRNEELSKIQSEIINAIQIVARDNNYDIVLSEGVIYATPELDMTNFVIEYLNRTASDQ